MTLKRRVAINVAIAFSVLFGLAAVIIYYAFASFRREEFKGRLEEKALTTARLLLEVKEIDESILRLLDRNTINAWYNEKTLVFDSHFKLIYSSIDDATIEWRPDDLAKLQNQKSFFKQEAERDFLGIHYSFGNQDYYILTAAEDKYGYTKLEFLKYALWLTFLGGTTLVWLSTYFFIKKLLKPLDEFEGQITRISANKLNLHLPESPRNDEIRLLTQAFNQMLLRMEDAFNQQKEFTANASHELRTPLTRIAFQTENLLLKPHPPETLAYLKSIQNDVQQLSDLINSLLILSKINKEEERKYFQPLRIDEVIFQATHRVKTQEARFDLDFEIVENPQFENTLEVIGVKALLEIAFINLLKNACNYSPNHKAQISIEQTAPHSITILVANQAPPLPESEQMKMFDSFFRGSNAANIPGSGLGLRITKRILDYHQASLKYLATPPDLHRFELVFHN
ncbi:MAG: HAMP domain-containing protein [Bacteroidetes bacterium]|nr:HAMP domain-containing protein [Bacteroidota bacterium]